MHYDYLVVGAGLFGAVFACEKTRQGKSCLVIDRRSHIAGNIYTENVNGIPVHRYGAHIFHTKDAEVWEYVNQFASFNHYVNSPIAKYKDELYNLPFNMNTFSKMWGVTTPAEAHAVIDEQVAKAREGMSGEPSNLEEQALSLVGRDVYEKLIKGYTEKQWGRDCKELPAFIIRRLPLRFIYDNNYFNDPYQGIPVEGYTAMVEKLLEGIEVKLETSLEEAKEDESLSYDTILYTGMIDEYYQYCYGPLEYRSLRFETEFLPLEDNYQGNAVVNYTEREIPYTRVIEHKHFVFGKSPEGDELHGTVVTKEYPATWTIGEEPYYPVNNEKNAILYEQYQALSGQQEKVIFGGRLGQYRYFDMDATVRAALDLSKE